MGLSIDTSKPAPGPWRMPNENERRCRVHFKRAFRDCVDVCEVNPDLEETTDATMRLIVAAPDLAAAARGLLAWRSMSYDDQAAQFMRDTGYMAPGKDAPMDSPIVPTAERRERWQSWLVDAENQLYATMVSALRRSEGLDP